MAGLDHLQLLKHLKIVLLQDSVILRQIFLNHPIWTDPLFDIPFYKVFAAQIAVGLINTKKSKNLQIRKILSIIADRIFMTYKDIKRIVVGEIIFIRDEISVLKKSVADFTIKRRDFTVFVNFDL